MCVEKIKACDLTKPFVYVSYSTRDKETVYADVVALQEAGQNVWIDVEANMTGNGYNSTIFSTIANANCKSLLVYASEESMTSAQTAKEIGYTESAEVLASHEEKLPIYVVELDDSIDQDLHRWIEGKLALAYGEDKLSIAEVERIEKYRKKYNNKMSRMDTKYDLCKANFEIMKEQASGQVSYTTDSAIRVEAIAALL